MEIVKRTLLNLDWNNRLKCFNYFYKVQKRKFKSYLEKSGSYWQSKNPKGKVRTECQAFGIVFVGENLEN